MTTAYNFASVKTDTMTGKTAKVLAWGGSLNASGGAFTSGGASYAVTAGKTFYLTAILLITKSATATALDLSYADDAAQTTNKVTLLNLITITASTVIVAGNLTQWMPMYGITVPATKYFGVFNTAAVASTSQIWAIGYEA